MWIVCMDYTHDAGNQSRTTSRMSIQHTSKLTLSHHIRYTFVGCVRVCVCEWIRSTSDVYGRSFRLFAQLWMKFEMDKNVVPVRIGSRIQCILDKQNHPKKEWMKAKRYDLQLNLPVIDVLCVFNGWIKYSSKMTSTSYSNISFIVNVKIVDDSFQVFEQFEIEATIFVLTTANEIKISEDWMNPERGGGK